MYFLDTRVLCYYEESLTRICDLVNYPQAKDLWA